MSVPTTQEMLNNVKIAINAILTGGAVQSYSVGGRSLQRMSLPDLQKLKKDLLSELADENGYGRSYASFDR